MFDIFNDISPDTVQKMMEKEKETAPVTYTLYISDEKVINFLDSQKYGSFSNSTADIDLWETINKNCKDNDIKLVIYGREVEHYLKKICKGAV